MRVYWIMAQHFRDMAPALQPTRSDSAAIGGRKLDRNKLCVAVIQESRGINVKGNV